MSLVKLYLCNRILDKCDTIGSLSCPAQWIQCSSLVKCAIPTNVFIFVKKKKKKNTNSKKNLWKCLLAGLNKCTLLHLNVLCSTVGKSRRGTGARTTCFRQRMNWGYIELEMSIHIAYLQLKGQKVIYENLEFIINAIWCSPVFPLKLWSTDATRYYVSSLLILCHACTTASFVFAGFLP